MLSNPRGILAPSNSIDKHQQQFFHTYQSQLATKYIRNTSEIRPDLLATMEVISGRRVSALNPYAAPFVPVAYRAVEDYSPQWWQLMESTPWFRDYWFHECFLDPELVDANYDYEPSLPDDVDSLFYEEEKEGSEGRRKDKRSGEELVLWGLQKWRQSRGLAEAPRYAEKAPKFVNHRISPRTIHQPK